MLTLTQKDKLVLKNLNIKALILFGSRAQGISHEGSDYDFFVIGEKSSKTYDSLYDLLESKINKLTDIDIVFEKTAPMELQNHVVRHGKVLYEKNQSTFADFKERVIAKYSDFEPLRNIFSNATIARINP
jgi:predicted nucleotidyltransferase